jgi:hypothetical protein
MVYEVAEVVTGESSKLIPVVICAPVETLEYKYAPPAAAERFVLFLYKKATAFEGLAQYKLKVEVIKILLEEDVGVIEAVKLVVIAEVEVVAYIDDVVPCTTCNTDPVGNVAFGMFCVPVRDAPDTDAISPEATCVKAIIDSPLLAMGCCQPQASEDRLCSRCCLGQLE